MPGNRFAVWISALLWLSLAATPAAARGPGEDRPGLPPHDERIAGIYAPFADLLDDFVEVRDVVNDGSADSQGSGRVSAFDYAGALAAGTTADRLDRQDRLLARFDPATLSTREQALAFWINAYNYFMIAHVLREAEKTGELVDGVKDFGSLFRPFAVFEREIFDVGGENYSLDGIEKGTLFGDDFLERGWFDPRVHFAINCASVGCPPLRAELYRPDRVDAQLDDNTRRSLATDLHLRIGDDRVRWSSLFDWYEDDFEVGYDSPTDFVARHLEPSRAQAVRNAGRIGTIDYDWRLNRPSNFPRLSP